MSTLAEILIDAGPAAAVLALAALFNRAAEALDGNRYADWLADHPTLDWWWTAEPPDIAAHIEAAEAS